MAKFDRKKFRKEIREKEVLAKEENPYEDFEGSPAELFFIKLGNLISKNRVPFFGTIFAVIMILVGVVAWGEYRSYREDQATSDVEKLERKHTKADPGIDGKIKDYEDFLTQHSTKNTTLRVSKLLSDFYIEKKEYAKAADYMEKAAGLLSDMKEIQSFYYYVAGNYRDKAGESKTALENYQKSAVLLGSNKETSNLTAWVYFQMGRLKLKEGQKESGIADLKKVLEVEAKYESPFLAEVKQLATYLILKANKG